MKKRLIILLVLAQGIQYAFGQTDSSMLSMGNLTAAAPFIQHITISAKDLERFPASSLDEAIKAYFNGAYSTASNLVYVIDGNFHADVNAYNIHDIESITLVQDARGRLNGAIQDQHLVLINTRTAITRQSGISFSSASWLSQRRNENGKGYYRQDDPTLFHQVHSSGKLSYKNIEAGASIAFLHDAFSVQTQPGTLSQRPHYLNRYSIKGWFTAMLGKPTQLTLRMNASPQDSGNTHQYRPDPSTTSFAKSDGKRLILYPSLGLKTQFLRRFSNELNASYSHNKSTQSFDIRRQGAQAFAESRFLDSSRYTDNTLGIRDQLGFEAKAGQWTILPAINAAFTKTGAHGEANHYMLASADTTAMVYVPPNISYRTVTGRLKYTQLVLTPSVAASLANRFFVQAGVQHSSPLPFLHPTSRLSPFASISADGIRLIKPGSRSSLMLYGSYAKAGSQVYSSDPPAPVMLPGLGFSSSLQPIAIVDREGSTPSDESATGGAAFAFPGQRVKIFYTFSTHDYFKHADVTTAANMQYRDVANVRLSTHRIGIDYRSKEDAAIQYRGSAGIYGMYSSLQFERGYTPYADALGIHSFYPPDGWSGGTTHHLSFRNFSTGVTAMYYLNEQVQSVEQPDVVPYYRWVNHKANSFVLQHVYAGYRCSEKLDLFASVRNVLATDKSTTGNLAYYGIGLRAAMMRDR